MKEKLEIYSDIDYHLLIDKFYDSICEKLFNKLLPNVLTVPLTLADKMLYLYILNNCDRYKFEHELYKYKQVAIQLEVIVPFHVTLLNKYANLMNTDANKIIYDFNEVLLQFYMNNDCLYWFDYLNKICIMYEEQYQSLINNNIELILDYYWEHLQINQFSTHYQLFKKLMYKVTKYNIKISKEKQKSFIEYICNFEGHNYNLIKQLDKIKWYDDTIHLLRIKIESQLKLEQLGAGKQCKI